MWARFVRRADLVPYAACEDARPSPETVGAEDAGEPTREDLLSSGIVEVASPVSRRQLLRRPDARVRLVQFRRRPEDAALRRPHTGSTPCQLRCSPFGRRQATVMRSSELSHVNTS